MRTIDAISNELEFGLHSVEAGRVIAAYGPGLIHEVNMRDMAELNVSMAPDVRELNRRLYEDVRRLIQTADHLGGTVYAGSSVLSDVSGIQPKRYRTTSMSETFAEGLLDITSQQVVLGIPDEAFGFELYDVLRRANPALVALAASSPFALVNGRLADTSHASRRIEQYKHSLRFFPDSVWRGAPELHSMKDYNNWLGSVSQEVINRLAAGKMDPNWEELKRTRRNGAGDFAYYPFERLEPHQVYTPIRIRPDHGTIESGGGSLFSLELRSPDIATTTERMRMLNALVAGIAYHVADHGSIPVPFSGSFEELELAAHHGLNAEISGVPVRKFLDGARDIASKGLAGRGYGSDRDLDVMERVLAEGNDADLIRKLGVVGAGELRIYLAGRLRNGESL